jgi:protein gp37
MTKIEWTHPQNFKGDVWNPVVGCTHHGAGCKHCYADELHTKRHKAFVKHGGVNPKGGKPMARQYAHPFEKVQLLPERLDAPLRRRKPTCYFVNSVSDLFHKDVPFEFIAAVYGVMAACPQHRFIVLTKRPERMLEFMQWAAREDQVGEGVNAAVTEMFGHAGPREYLLRDYPDDVEDAEFSGHISDELVCNPPEWPLANVITGASIANQADADRIIPVLLQVPSACRAISLEPMIGPVTLPPDCFAHFVSNETLGRNSALIQRESRVPGYSEMPDWIKWVIVGGESGPNARPSDVAWIRSIVQQCKAAGVPCFVKQVGSKPRGHAQWEHEDNEGYGVDPELSRLIDRKGGDPDEWPEDIRVRQYPPALTGENAPYPVAVTIECPECENTCEATKHFYEGDPFASLGHTCEHCGYEIMESEWNEVNHA